MAIKRPRRTEEDIKNEILEMSAFNIRQNTQWIVKFEDHGQDFLEWHISESGHILDSKPCQRTIWTGKFTIPETAKVGKKLAIWNNGESFVNYPIKEITKIKPTDKYVLTGKLGKANILDVKAVEGGKN